MVSELTEMADQIEMKWGALRLFLALGLGVNLIAWSRGFFVQLHPGYRPGIQGRDVLRGFAAFLFAEILFVPSLLSVIFYALGIDLALSIEQNSQLKGWVNLSIILGGFIAVLGAYLGLNGPVRKGLWGNIKKSWLYQLGMGVSAWVISYPVVMAFSLLLSLAVGYFFTPPPFEQAAVQHVRLAKSSPFLFGLTALSVVIIIPLTEEYLFRGLLQSWVKERLSSPYLAIVISSFIFAFFHFSIEYGIGNIEFISALFLLSCMLGYLFERQRSLLSPIALHGFFNLVSLIIVFQE